MSDFKKRTEERIKDLKKYNSDCKTEEYKRLKTRNTSKVAINNYYTGLRHGTLREIKYLESLNVSDYLTVKHLLNIETDKREWTVVFLDYCLFTEPAEKACYKRIENELKCGNVSDYVSKEKHEELAYRYISERSDLEEKIKSDYVKKTDVKHTLDDLFGAEPLCQDLINLLESKEIAKKRRDSIFELKQSIIESLELG